LTPDQVAQIDSLVSRRAGAKLSRNYKTADNIRDELKEDYNVFIDDRLKQWSVGGEFGPDAPGNQDKHRPWAMSMYSASAADESQVPMILAELERRNEAKAARDFDTADDIRELLSSEYNVAIDDRLREWSIGGDFGLKPKKNDGAFVRRGGGELTEDEEAEIMDIVEERARAKKGRDFETADEMRDLLEAKYSVKVDDKSKFHDLTASFSRGKAQLTPV
jgi:cysteinyl-tRNA synthetase